MIPREQQFAEKLNAYAFPRTTPNNRVKDLVDLALPLDPDALNRQRVLDALRPTFERKATHAMPAELAAPPSDWPPPFRALAAECGLPTDITIVFSSLNQFLEKVLAG